MAATFTLPCPRSWRGIRCWAVRLFVGLAAFIVVGNVAILGLSAVARQIVDTSTVQGVEGVPNLRAVDGKVWRGGHPSIEGHESLAAAGVTTIVDLRAEHDAAARDDFIESLGMDVVHIPIRDGQTPSAGDVDRFVDVVGDSEGPVFVHCGAGVGRAGAMVAGYLGATGGAGPIEAVSHNLAVGPPTFEQIIFAGTGGSEPDIIVKGMSRILDSPRRIWHNL